MFTIPAVFAQGQNVTFVLDAGHTVLISMLGSKDFAADVARQFLGFGVLRSVVPQQAHHHLTYTSQSATNIIN